MASPPTADTLLGVYNVETLLIMRCGKSICNFKKIEKGKKPWLCID
jgi:hypothetical protein